MNVLRKILASLLIVSFVSVLIGGCNTIEGAGEDLERGGEEIQEAAD